MRKCENRQWVDCTEADYQANSPHYNIVENSNDTCWDSVDNDCNGMADASEPLCQPAGIIYNACSQDAALDINGDGVVNLNDMIIILRKILMNPNQVVGSKECNAININTQ
jgi:hypothetical protein